MSAKLCLAGSLLGSGASKKGVPKPELGNEGTPQDMVTLGIETSGRIASVALHRDSVCLAERTLAPSGRRHAQTLVAEVDALFRSSRTPKNQCELVAVSIGPGSFTGLRIGVVFAKTFAYALGCRVAAVDTCLCVAQGCPPDVDDVYVIGDAQRAQLYVGHYVRAGASDWSRTGPITISDAQPWCADRGPFHVVTGPALERLTGQIAWPCRVLDASYWHPRASVVAQLGDRRLLLNQCDDVWSLEPFYVRKSAAEEKWDAAQKE